MAGARNREEDTLSQARKIVAEHRLEMKLGDVEFQGDGSKCTFYYTAEQRVDFRELVRPRGGLQGPHRDAPDRRAPGIGPPWRHWRLRSGALLFDLADRFPERLHGAARYQQLSLNPQKLAGQCGKLKCCLNFELDQYKEAVRPSSPPSTKLMTRKARRGYFKTDIFGGKMWFQYFDEPGASPVPIELEDVREIMAMNERGEKPDDLTGYAVQAEAAPEDALFGDVVGQDDLNRFDSPSGRRRKGRKGGSRRRGQNSGRKGGDAPAAQNGEGGGNSGRRRKKRRNRKGPSNAS